MTIDYITSDVTITEGSLGSIEEDCQGLCRVIWDDHPEIVLPTSGDAIVQVPLWSSDENGIAGPPGAGSVFQVQQLDTPHGLLKLEYKVHSNGQRTYVITAIPKHDHSCFRCRGVTPYESRYFYDLRNADSETLAWIGWHGWRIPSCDGSGT